MLLSSRTHAVAMAFLLSACGDLGGVSASTEETGETGATAVDTTGETTSTSGEATTATPTTTEAPTTEAPTTEASTTTAEEIDILEQLRAIDGMEVSELSSPVPDHRFFTMRYAQPADHDAPDGAVFAQRMNLLHRDVGAPTVIVTSGYNINPSWAQTRPVARRCATSSARCCCGAGPCSRAWRRT